MPFPSPKEKRTFRLTTDEAGQPRYVAHVLLNALCALDGGVSYLRSRGLRQKFANEKEPVLRKVKDAMGVTGSQWSSAVDALADAGVVTRTGSGRGSTFVLPQDGQALRTRLLNLGDLDAGVISEIVASGG